MDISDYLLERVFEAIPELSLFYKVLIILISVILFILYKVHKDTFTVYRDAIYKIIKSHSRKLLCLVFLLIVILVVFYIVDNSYSPKPPEDQLVVAIAPFYYIDEYGKSGADINIANYLRERIEAEKDLKIKVIILDNPIHNKEDAESQGENKGVHLVVYGEIKKSMGGSIGEVKYYILPLSSLEITPSEILFLKGEDVKVNDSIFTDKTTFSMVTEEPIVIIEALKENTSSLIFTIGAFENYKKSDFTLAISFFKSIGNYENNSIFLYYIGNCHSYNNNLNEGLRYFNKSTEKDPQFEEAWYNKGFVLDVLGKYAEAIAAYDNATDIDPDYLEAWNNKGVVLCELGRYGEAIVAYNNATDIDLDFAEAWNNKAVAFSGLGRYEDAITACDKAIEIDSNYTIAWCNKGNNLFSLGEYEEAEKAYDEAIKIDSNFTGAWYNKGNNFLALGEYERARGNYDKANVAYEKAIAAYDNATDIDPDCLEAWSNKGVALHRLDRYEEAENAYNKAIKIDQNLTSAWVNKGNNLLAWGEYEEAEKAYDRAIEINPQCADAWIGKSIALSYLDKPEESLLAALISIEMS